MSKVMRSEVPWNLENEQKLLGFRLNNNLLYYPHLSDTIVYDSLSIRRSKIVLIITVLIWLCMYRSVCLKSGDLRGNCGVGTSS